MALGRFKKLVLGTNLVGTDNGDDSLTIDATGGAPSGAAGGDLGGSYPNPEVDIVDDDVLGSGTPTSAKFLRGDRTWATPPTSGGVDSLAKSGDTQLTGDVTLSEGANVTLTQVGQDIQIAASTGGGGGAGTELDYAQITSNVTVNGSSGAPNNVVSGAAVTYDGSTRVKIEFFSPIVSAGSAALIVDLYDGASNLGRIGQTGAAAAMAMKGETFLTPTAGSHTYHIKAWKNGGTDGSVAAAAGTFLPAFMRITTA